MTTTAPGQTPDDAVRLPSGPIDELADFLGEDLVNEIYMHAFDRRSLSTQDLVQAGFPSENVPSALAVLTARGLIAAEGEDHWRVVPPSRSLPPLAARLEERAQLIRTSLPGLTSAYRTAGRVLDGPQLHGIEFLPTTADIAIAITQCFAQSQQGANTMRRGSLASRYAALEAMPTLKDGRVGALSRRGGCVTVLHTELVGSLSAEDLRAFDEVPHEQRLVSGHVPFTALATESSAIVELMRDGEPEGFLITNPALVQGIAEVIDFVTASATPWSGAPHPPADAELEASEKAILHLLAVGVPDATIARRLNISPRTFDRRLRKILDKLGAATRFQAGVMASRRDWV